MMLLGQLLMDSPLVSLLALTTRSVEIFGARFGMFFCFAGAQTLVRIMRLRGVFNRSGFLRCSLVAFLPANSPIILP